MENGCDGHLAEAAPGCPLCYAHLQGQRDAMRSEVKKLRGFMDRGIEYLNLAMLESFGGVRFTREEQLDAAAEALRLLHEGLSHQPNCAKCRDKRVVELGAGYLGECPVCCPKDSEVHGS